MTARRGAIILLIALALTGCGYSLTPSDGPAPGGIVSVAIPTVGNATTYFDLTNSLTNELIRQFSLSKRLDVTDRGRADGILTAEVRSVQIESAVRTVSGEDSVSRRVIVEVDAVLRSTEDNRVLWQSRQIVGRKTYSVTDDQSEVEANLAEALDVLAGELAEKIHNSLFEAF